MVERKICALSGESTAVSAAELRGDGVWAIGNGRQSDFSMEPATSLRTGSAPNFCTALNGFRMLRQQALEREGGLGGEIVGVVVEADVYVLR